MLAKSFAQKVDSNSREMNQQLWKKHQGTAQILKCSPILTVDSDFFLGDKFVKQFSLQFQQLK
jgi:hypothetical protein